MGRNMVKIIGGVLFAFALLVIMIAAKRKDTDAPEITVPDEVITYHEGDATEVLLAGVTAHDKKDGDVTDTLFVVKIAPTKDKTEAVVTYAARDSKNNITKVNRTVNYVAKPEETPGEEVGGEITDIPAPTPTEAVTPTPTEEAGPTDEVTPSPTEEVTPTEEPEATDAPTKKVTPTPTKKATPTPTKKPQTPTPTEQPDATSTPSPEPTEAPVTLTPEPSEVPTLTPEPTPTEVPATPTPEPNDTPSPEPEE